MNNALKQLFDFQKFESNDHLSKVIEDVDASNFNLISDKDLFLVNAGTNIPTVQEDKNYGDRE